MRVFRFIKNRTVGLVLLGAVLIGGTVAIGSNVVALAASQLPIVKALVTGGPAATQASGCVVGAGPQVVTSTSTSTSRPAVATALRST